MHSKYIVGIGVSLIAIAAAGGMLETPSDDRRGWEQDELRDCWPWPSTGPWKLCS